MPEQVRLTQRMQNEDGDDDGKTNEANDGKERKNCVG